MVTILLATQNGEKNLKAQLESIGSQTYGNWNLVVRDNGSTDRTIEILENFSKQFPNQVSIEKSDSAKETLKEVYIQMLQNAHGPHFMLCAQDDLWKQDKIYLCMQKMEALEARYGTKVPILVHTDYSVTDENLQMKAESFFQYAKIPKRILLNHLIVQNPVCGATVMINRNLQQYFLQHLPESQIQSIEYWCALVAKVFGRIGFVNEPTMYCREHIANIGKIGRVVQPKLFVQRMKEGKESYRRLMIESMEQIRGFIDIYGEEITDLETYELLKTYGELYYKGKIRRLSFYRKRQVMKEGRIRKLMQWLWG